MIHKNKLCRKKMAKHRIQSRCFAKYGNSIWGVCPALAFGVTSHRLVNRLPTPFAVEGSAGIVPLVEPLLLALKFVVAVQAIAA